jgi:hypothetical protein
MPAFVCACSLPPLPHLHVAHTHTNSRNATHPQWHGLYVALFPLAQPTPVAIELHKLKDTNKNLLRRLRATEKTLAQSRIDSYTAIDHCDRKKSEASVLARGEAAALYNELDTVSAVLNHTLLVRDHTERAWTTKEKTLTAKLNANRRKVETGQRREEAGKEREQRLAEIVDKCGQQLRQQTQETTEAKTKLAAMQGTVRQGTCSVQLYEFAAGFPSSIGAWWEKRQQDNANKKAEAARAAARLARERAEAARVVPAKKAKSFWIARALRIVWRGLLSLLGSVFWMIMSVLMVSACFGLAYLAFLVAIEEKFWDVKGGLFTFALWIFLDFCRVPLRIILACGLLLTMAMCLHVEL